jgi:hypothetical protein
MKKRFTEEQIIGILKEAEAGLKVGELCRKMRQMRGRQIRPFLFWWPTPQSCFAVKQTNQIA